MQIEEKGENPKSVNEKLEEMVHVPKRDVNIRTITPKKTCHDHDHTYERPISAYSSILLIIDNSFHTG